MANFNITSLVVCDDIRREVNQKDILIGVYGAGITVHQLPTFITLAFWIEFSSRRKGTFDLFIRVDGPNQLPSPELRFNIELPADQDSHSAFTPQIPISIEREGKLRIFAKSLLEAKYDLVKSKPITYVPLSASFGFPQKDAANAASSPSKPATPDATEPHQ